MSATAAPTATTFEFPELILADRCERCGAQGFVQTYVHGTLLIWCGHHFRKHELALMTAGAAVNDYRPERLWKNTKPYQGVKDAGEGPHGATAY